MYHAFKLFWDGSLSIHTGFHLASMANKRFVEALQQFRIATENHEEPPVTFTHGAQTQEVILNQLKRIKFEQKEAQEKAKWEAKQAKLARKAERAANGDGDEDEEEDEEEEEPAEEEEEEDEDGVKKNKDEIRVDHMADFQIHDCCEFSLKVMQGEPIRAL